MTPRLLAAVLIVALSTSARIPSASGQDSTKWGSAGGWDVRIDRSVGDGCFIIAYFDNGTALRMGMDIEHKIIYVMIADIKWKFIEAGREYEIKLQMEKDAQWDAIAQGYLTEDLQSLLIYSDKTEFIDEFSKKSQLGIWYDGAEIAAFSLAGTGAAIAEMIKCQRAVSNSSRRSGEPDPLSEDRLDSFSSRTSHTISFTHKLPY